MTPWAIDKKGGRVICPAWGGTLIADKSAPGGKWAMRWESAARRTSKHGETDELVEHDDPELTITAGVHFLDRFGLAAIPAVADPLAELMTCASFAGSHAIHLHLKRDFADRLGDALDGPGPAVHFGPDPF